ncbi:hypothetical protein BGZ58_009047 [Dissophora ornata]|nr:hypothetical protein BGZ58_009047 [Dissophora ornata]
MNDHEMDVPFDFTAFTLDEPEERLQQAFEHSLHLDSNTDQHEYLTSTTAIPHPNTTAPTTSTPSATLTAGGASSSNGEASSAPLSPTQIPDNGAWAKLPSPSEVNPFQPGITAQKLDAMAMDPNHVFKSAQTPDPSPFPVPPPQPSASLSSDMNMEASGSTSQPSSFKGKGKESDNPDSSTNDNKEEMEEEKGRISQWMLGDPKLTSQSSGSEWDITDASGPPFTSEDFTLVGGDWASSDSFSTMVDSNIMFGFSSYPTYESLPISGAIAEEQHRRAMEAEAELSPVSEDPSTSFWSNSSESQMKEGGFARYVKNDQMLQWGSQGTATTTTSTALASNQQHQQWQNWRSVPELEHDLDLDLELDYNALDEGSPKIK